MNLVAETIRKEAYARLKERYGKLVDEIFVEVEGEMRTNRSLKMKFQIFDWKQTSVKPTQIEIEGAIGVGVAEMEYALYRLLNFGEEKIEQAIHLNHNLPKNGIHMHPTIYAELMKSERASMGWIEERLKMLRNKK